MGSITKASEGLTSLSEELAENSGITDSLTKWLEDMFGKWGDTLKTMILSVGIMFAILVTCGCCCIPCMRELMQRLITTTLTRQQLMLSVCPHREQLRETCCSRGTCRGWTQRKGSLWRVYPAQGDRRVDLRTPRRQDTCWR